MLWWWPLSSPSAGAWAAVAALAVLCTGFAYTLYFRLMLHVGPTNALSVTFLIPAFGILWGAVFLGEPVNAVMPPMMPTLTTAAIKPYSIEVTPCSSSRSCRSGVIKVLIVAS